jgi:hypothetical protein
MLIARLTISFERGVKTNRPKHLGLESTPSTTEEGGTIRGLGTHFVSKEAQEMTRICEKEDVRIRTAFRARFLISPLEGIYFVPEKGMAKNFIKDLNVRPEVTVRVAEFELTQDVPMEDAELKEWSERVKINTVSIGRSKEADENGLRCLEYLVSCPMITKETAQSIKNLINDVRSEKIQRVEFKRALDMVNVEVEASVLLPRRAPISKGE